MTGSQLQFPPLGSWAEEAECLRMDPRVFTSQKADPTYPEDLARAKNACSHCPVTQQCLDYAMTYRPFGVWGGLTDGERRQLRKGQRVVEEIKTQTRIAVCPRCLTSVVGGVCGRCGSQVGGRG